MGKAENHLRGFGGGGLFAFTFIVVSRESSLVGFHMPIIPSFGRARQKDLESEVNPGCIVRLCHKSVKAKNDLPFLSVYALGRPPSLTSLHLIS